MGKSGKIAARKAMERRQTLSATPSTAKGPAKVQTRVTDDLEADAAASQFTAAALGKERERIIFGWAFRLPTGEMGTPGRIIGLTSPASSESRAWRC